MILLHQTLALLLPVTLLIIPKPTRATQSVYNYSIPDNVLLESEVLYMSADTTETNPIYVEEFVDRRAGSVLVRVADKRERSESRDYTSYYRISESSETTTSIKPDSLVVYDPEDNLCRQGSTSTWKLADLSSILNVMFESKNFNLKTDEIQNDVTAIGPLALLRIVFANADQFTFKDKEFDNVRLQQMLSYFTTVRIDERLKMNVVCRVPETNVRNGQGKTLANLDLSSYCSTISVIFGANKSVIPVKVLIVKYYLLEEQSSSRQVAVTMSKSDSVKPLAMPVGSGCGSVLAHNLFYVAARQMSGVYSARDIRGERYIAYDNESKHLRVDLIGDHKCIVELKTMRVVYISDSSTFDDPTKTTKGDGRHCAQTYLSQKNDEFGFYKTQSMEELIGFGSSVGLLHLGTGQLEDGTDCIVFEREIAHSMIPLLVRMNLRFRVISSHRFFLTFYFVEELAIDLHPNDYRDETAYKSMWLRRVELNSVSPVSRYKILSSQIDFSEFVWNLETMVEDTQDRESKLMHPARTFDTNECKAAQDQTQLELLIKQKESDSDLDASDQVEAMEESLMFYLSKATRFPRSHICDLGVALAPSSEVARQYVHVKAKLIKSIDYNYDYDLLGWIHSMDSVPFYKYGDIIKGEPMSRLECAMKLATTQLPNQANNTDRINMVHCPNVGCGYLHDMDSLNYTKQSTGEEAPLLQDYYYLCEISALTKAAGSHMTDIDKFSPKTFMKLMDQASISLDLTGSAPDTSWAPTPKQPSEQQVFEGTVVKVAAQPGLGSDSIGDLLRTGLCYSKETRATSDAETNPYQVIELEFELNQSVFQCHKACHLTPMCITYSYSKRERRCTITNIPKAELSSLGATFDQAPLEGTKEDESCSLYSTNSIHLYNSRVIQISKLSSFFTDKRADYYVTLLSLEDCANLCHWNENVCHVFYYLRQESVCVVQDKDSYLYKKLEVAKETHEPAEKLERFAQHVGSTWSSYTHWNKYERDYDQYYAWDRGTRYELTLGDSSDQLVEEKVVYDIGEEDCLRECTVVEPNCFMVDHCFIPVNGVMTRYCKMFNLKLESKKLDNLATLEQQGSMIRMSGCCHYNLTGDYQVLRREMARQVQLKRADWIDDIANQDADRGKSYMDRLKVFVADQQLHVTMQKAGTFFAAVLFLLIGMSSGVSLAVFGPDTLKMKYLAVNFAESVRERFKQTTERRDERSSSRVEFHELADIDA